MANVPASPAADQLIVSVSGLRGIVGGSLTPEVAERYALAFAAGLPPGSIVLGRDGRGSGPLFAATIAAALRKAGRDVVDCGIAATPTVGIVVREERAAGGIQISASHNPAPYNGLKLFSAEGRVLPAAAGAAVLERFRLGATPSPAAAPGDARRADGTAAHVALVLATVDAEAIRRRRFRVWLDACHGAGSRVARPLLERLGCAVEIVGGEPDGRFEHPPEPTAEHLAPLLPRIAAAGAHVGFFQDPDADRLAIADAAGGFLGEEATLALAVEAVLARRPGPIAVNCSTSGMAGVIAARHGLPCHVASVGEANVVDCMLAHGCVLGGEGNGGVIDPRVVLVRDSAVAMALVLERMCGPEPDGIEPVAARAAALPATTMRKTKVGLSADTRGEALEAALARIAAAFPEATVSRQDGLRLDWRGGWLLVRSSNTEPIVRIVAEAAVDGPAGTAAVDAAIARAAAALTGG